MKGTQLDNSNVDSLTQKSSRFVTVTSDIYPVCWVATLGPR